MKWIVFALVMMAIIACAPKPETVLAPAGAAPPDSLKVKAVVQVTQEGKTQKFPAVLFAVPEKRYRLELTGPLGIGVASLLWTPEGWTAVFPTEERYATGFGDCVRVLGLPGANIHKFAAIAWGAPADSIGCAGELPAFEVSIKKADPSATWGDGIWKLPVPEGYIRLN